MLRTIAVVLVLASTALADETQDFVYLGAQPVFLRLRVLVDGKDHRTPFTTWLRGVFDRADADKDGRLSRDESKAVLEIAEFRSAESSPAGRRDWKQDPDGNGFIEFEEMVSAVENGAGPALQVRMTPTPDANARFRGQQQTEDPQRIFKHVDADKDSRLSDLEIESALSALRKFDRDDDETVSAAEISSANPYAMYFAPQVSTTTAPAAIPLLELNAAELSGRAIRQFFQRYDLQDANGVSDLVLAPEELPISDAVFKAHDANGDGRLDFDEVPVLLKQMEPQVEFTLHISVQWERTPAIDFVCHDDRWKDRVRRSYTGDVTIDFGDAQLELSVPAAGNSFDTTQFLEQQFKAGDTDNNGYVEQKELRSNYYMNQLFAQADADKDGKLFLKELRAHVDGRKQAGESRTVVDLADAGRSLFEILDVNRDRRLSPAEVKALGPRARAWDADKDGALGEAEVPRHFRLTARRGTAQIPGLNFVTPAAVFAPNFVNRSAPGPTWFTRMDRNSDSEVTPREFLGPPELFGRLDLNGDGTLDVTEAQTAKK